MSIRILHVTDAASAGVLAAVAALARAQSETGARVTFAYVPRVDSPPLAAIQELTGDQVVVRRWSRSHRTAVPALALRLGVALVGHRYQVVHLHSSRTGMIGRALAAVTGNRGRTVYSPHCFAFDRTDLDGVRRAVFTGLERLGTWLGPRLVLVSATEQALARRVLPRSRTAVLGNRVDVTALARMAEAARDRGGEASGTAPSPEDGTGSSTGPLSIVHVGRIAAQKRPGEFAALARERAGKDLGFRWLGDGDRSQLGPEVEVTGWLDRAHLHEELARADLMLFTSAGEGMPVSVLEAQAMGIPVVAHRVTGLADVVLDGATGLLRSDTASLGRALDELTTDPARRRGMGRAARVHMQKKHDLADLAADSFAAYRALGIIEKGLT